jgi:ribosomal protein S27AE
MKTCSRCGLSKDESEYHKDKSRKDGLFQWCNTCQKEHDVKYRREHRKQHANQARQWRADNREIARNIQVKASQKHRQINPEKAMARSAVTHAVRDGKLIKQPCEVCGNLKAQAHHDDYSKPLQVRWLCQKHHTEHHQKGGL